MVKIAPSILSADFGALGEAVARVEAGGADQIHVDVMDGHFVPNLSIGPPVIEAIRKRTRLPLDVHLMIESPERWVNPLLLTVNVCQTVQATLTGILAGRLFGAVGVVS